MGEWKKGWDNDTGHDDEGYVEWFTVTDGVHSFKCDTEADADFLLERLRADISPPASAQQIEAIQSGGARATLITFHRSQVGYYMSLGHSEFASMSDITADMLTNDAQKAP